MLSSTSGSSIVSTEYALNTGSAAAVVDAEQPATKRPEDAVWGIRALLLLLLLIGALLESVARFGVPLINSNQRRIRQEYQQALSLGHAPGQNRISVFFVGNSLTMTDLDMPGLQEGLGPDYQPVRWSIDNTNYLDWYFGLHRVFREGGRPSVVAVGTLPRNLLRSRVRGGYFAHYLLHRRDLLEAAARTKADANSASDLVVAHFSGFYGSREEINKRLLTWMLPSFPEFGEALAGRTLSRRLEESDVRLIASRLAELKVLCTAYGARLVVWIPPTLSASEDAAVAQAGQRVGVDVLIPRPEDWLPRERFLDGLHLDKIGAARWTEALASRLLPLLTDQLSPGRPPMPRPMAISAAVPHRMP
jgi:hypothetical protein